MQGYWRDEELPRMTMPTIDWDTADYGLVVVWNPDLDAFLCEEFPELEDESREKMMWFIREMVRVNQNSGVNKWRV